MNTINRALYTILERDKAGETISVKDKGYEIIMDIITEAQRITAELNTGYHSPEKVQMIFSQLTGVVVDSSFTLMPPFYTDFGKNIRVGKNVFINQCCTFMDRGGITLQDKVYIAPKVNLITTNHPIDPSIRQSTISKPIVLEENVWIGAAASIMPGITIGKNSIVGANAVVTKNVPQNCIVAGNPAKIIKRIEVE